MQGGPLVKMLERQAEGVGLENVLFINSMISSRERALADATVANVMLTTVKLLILSVTISVYDCEAASLKGTYGIVPYSVYTR